MLAKRRGFTIIEVLVATAILGSLTAIVYYNTMGARQTGRDTARVSDVAQLQTALRLYAEANDQYPAHDNGVLIGAGGALDTQLAPYLSRIPRDPLHNGVTNGYYYDSNVTCTAAGQRVLYARTAETADARNFSTVCSCGGSCSGFNLGVPTNGHIILLR
jgi:prepilin-type N-terminal cleavage/methylation domain-containing protein